MKGIISWFNKSKGYGMIHAPGCDPFFVHWAQCKEVKGDPKEGDLVEFKVKFLKQGDEAINVKRRTAK